jgi:hypothetical protein
MIEVFKTNVQDTETSSRHWCYLSFASTHQPVPWFVSPRITSIIPYREGTNRGNWGLLSNLVLISFCLRYNPGELCYFTWYYLSSI